MSFHSVNERWARNDSVCMMLPCVGPLTGLGVDFHLFWAVYFPFFNGAMGGRIDPSWWTHSAISRSNQ